MLLQGSGSWPGVELYRVEHVTSSGTSLTHAQLSMCNTAITFNKSREHNFSIYSNAFSAHWRIPEADHVTRTRAGSTLLS